MEAIWPDYRSYNQAWNERILSRSRFVMGAVSLISLISLVNGYLTSNAPVAVSAGVAFSLFAASVWMIGFRFSTWFAVLLALITTGIALGQIAYFRPEFPLTFALAIYCVNLARGCFFRGRQKRANAA